MRIEWDPQQVHRLTIRVLGRQEAAQEAELEIGENGLRIYMSKAFSLEPKIEKIYEQGETEDFREEVGRLGNVLEDIKGDYATLASEARSVMDHVLEYIHDLPVGAVKDMKTESEALQARIKRLEKVLEDGENWE